MCPHKMWAVFLFCSVYILNFFHSLDMDSHKFYVSNEEKELYTKGQSINGNQIMKISEYILNNAKSMELDLLSKIEW